MMKMSPFVKAFPTAHFRARLVVLASTCSIIFSLVAAGGAQSASTVTIQAPADGSSAGAEVSIKGNARLKAGEFLWLVARRSDFEPVWWPQRALTPNASTGDFAGTATLGTARDIGYQFDLAVITVDAAGNQQLTDYRTNALTTNDYKPIRLPATTSPPRIVRVKKTSDR